MSGQFPTRRKARFRGTAVSLLLHGLLLFAALDLVKAPAVRVFLPGTAKGTQIDLAYNPGRAPQPTVATRHLKPLKTSPAPLLRAAAHDSPAPTVDQALAQLPRPHLPPLRQNSLPTDAQPPTTSEQEAGRDSYGTGDVQIALTTYAPSPRPDLSSLPRGTQGDVVLDVTIDPAGNVANLQLLRALGYGIEGSVMQTVRTWKFSPAKKDGVAVASVQELHFHYGRG
ncbi:MAG TPA: TonB family protein [Acidisarcina sp.]